MQRGEALRYMHDVWHLNPATARKKLQEAVNNPGQRIQVRTTLTVKAVAVNKPDHQWEFIFDDTRH